MTGYSSSSDELKLFKKDRSHKVFSLRYFLCNQIIHLLIVIGIILPITIS